VPFGKTRLRPVRFVAARAGSCCALAALLLLFGSRGLQNAIAEGDTRTISMHHIHTGEDITITYKRDGQYDEAALEKLNWFLRDWRRSESTRMDPHLIDLVWEVQREAGSNQPIWVVCGYRSPATNEMLRHNSSGVARFSQHMLGHAMDFYIPGVPLTELRAMGLRLARGGVGFYPTSGSPFVHMDTGSVRMWPRMSRQELARVFPDGRTVQIPSDGKPMPGYALALADVQKRGATPSANSVQSARAAGIDVGNIVVASDDGDETESRNPFAKLLGLKKGDEAEEADAAPAPAPIRTKAKQVVVAAVEKVKAVAVRVAAEPKLMRASALASTTPAPAAPAQVAAVSSSQVSLSQVSSSQVSSSQVSSSQVVNTRYWQGTTDNSAAAQSLLASARRPQGTQIASADPDTTGTLAPATPPSPALGFAEQPAAADTPFHAVSLAAAATSSGASDVLGQSDSTIAVKGINDQPKSTVQRAIQLAVAAVKVSERIDNPWLRAVILSPSVQRFLSTLWLGTRDLTSLAGLMAKPASAVMMTFSSDPNRGLPADHFSGSAIVFLTTISYPAPTHTAALQ
jgi:uncharacterized protein YcbK (DUF882 family)